MKMVGDFLEVLGNDMSFNVFLLLDDPADLVHVCCVSRSWRHFVIENELCKKLCATLFPELSSFSRAIEVNNSMDGIDAECSKSAEWESFEVSNRVYAHLARYLIQTKREDCILEAICASSTDNYPDERVENTLESGDIVRRRPSYWSSKGACDPRSPETLTYKLCCKLCIVDEVNIRPFKAFFQFGDPIYSAKHVRFKLGYSKVPLPSMSNPMIMNTGEFDDTDFVWTYVSPEFSMSQENQLQSFKLPKPVLCIGGVLQIELLGRTQKQDIDGLYYFCVCHVRAIGRPLSSFDADIKTNGSYTLKLLPQEDEPDGSPLDESSDEAPNRQRGWLALASRIRESGELTAAAIGGTFLNAFRGSGRFGNVHYHSDEEEEEEDDDDVDDEMLY